MKEQAFTVSCSEPTRQNWRRLLVLTKANGPIWPIPPGDRRCSGTTAPLHIGKSESENAARRRWTVALPEKKTTRQVRKAKSPYGDINPDQRPALLDELYHWTHFSG